MGYIDETPTWSDTPVLPFVRPSGPSLRVPLRRGRMTSLRPGQGVVYRSLRQVTGPSGRSARIMYKGRDRRSAGIYVVCVPTCLAWEVARGATPPGRRSAASLPPPSGPPPPRRLDRLPRAAWSGSGPLPRRRAPGAEPEDGL